MKSLRSLHCKLRRAGGRRGVALVIVLMFVALLTVLVAAFISQSTFDRQISSASASLAKADLMCQSAADTIVGDLRQEIAAGSTSQTVWTDASGVNTYLYRPKLNAAIVPFAVVPNASDITKLPNLVKQSVRGKSFYPASYDTGAQTRAVASSTTDPAANGRYISPGRWNKHLLLPKADPLNAGSTLPVTSFVAPDWILVSRDGSNPSSFGPLLSNAANTNSKFVVGRYAYAIYNQGGLLDANAAGSPALSSLSTAQQKMWRRKGALAFADLTALPGFSDLSPARAQQVVDALVGWRQYATAQPDGTFPSHTFTPAAAQRYMDAVLGLSNRAMTAGNASTFNGQSDQLFSSRQQLIFFLQNLATNDTERAAMQKALQYLSTFNRSLNQPRFQPHSERPLVMGAAYPGTGSLYSGGNSAFGLDDTFNPAFSSIRVNAAFTRNDGSAAVRGESLVKKRFAISRLCWLTYKGPSADLYASNPSDPAIVELLNQGVPVELIKQGTGVAGGDYKNGNIYKYFGLKWTAGGGAGGIGGYWTYDHGISSSSQPIIGTLDLVRDANREPDFFEILKAGTHAGALSKANTTFGNDLTQIQGIDRAKVDTRVDFHILQLAANIIDQADPDSFATTLTINNGSFGRSFTGCENLPYLYATHQMPILLTKPLPAPANPAAPAAVTPGVTLTEPGKGVILQFPTVWNPHIPGSESSLAGMRPDNLRVCVSLLSIANPTVSMTSPGSLNFYAFPRYVLSPNPNKDCLPYTTSPWRLGTVNVTKGMIDMPIQFSPGNNSMYFSNNASLYREPTPLMRPNIPGGSNLQIDAQNSMFTVGNLSTTELAKESGSNEKFIGFLMRVFPIRWNETVTTAGVPVTTTYTVNNIGIQSAVATTYSLEYQSNGVWIPYRQYVYSQPFSAMEMPLDDNGGTSGATYARNVLNLWTTGVRARLQTWDPRSERWGAAGDWNNGNFIDAAKTMVETVRPAAALGNNSHGYYWGGVSKDMFVSRSGGTLTKGADNFAYIIDADGMVRRGMAAWVPSATPLGAASTSTGMPLATTYAAGVGTPGAANASNRPVILNRPFRTVPELGATFCDTPWHNIDFFNPESGHASYLDIFCINDDTRPDARVAGCVDLNTRQKEVIKAILLGAYRDELGTLSTAVPLTAAEADTIATALLARTSNLTASNSGPLMNIAELVGKYVSGGYTNPNASNQPYDGFSSDVAIGANTLAINNVQRMRESAARALSDVGMAGTWNLLIDVVAQSGRYPTTATDLANFLVEGERRYWVHISIDRSSGEIIDQRIEVVNE